jgi:hypothetical protein
VVERRFFVLPARRTPIATRGVLTHLISTFSSTAWCMRDPEQIKRQIVELQLEHRDLDEIIAKLAQSGDVDELQMRRLKKRKLQIKDMVVLLQMQLTPDIPA